MEALVSSLLILHITAGAIGLISGTINIARRKGDRLHKVIGIIFFYAMMVVGFSAIVLSLFNPNHFLTIVGVFTIYMVGTGFRYIQLRLAGVDNDPKALDWVMTYGMGLAGVLFLALGINALIQGNTFGIVYIVFGSISLLFVRTDLANYRGKAKARNYWLLAHLQRMIGGYIAALTAFLVVNVDNFPPILPGVVYWFLPTVVLTPLIILWSRKYSM